MNIFELSNYSFNTYSIPFLVVGVGVLILGLFVLLRQLKSWVHITFSIVTLTFAWWLLGNAISLSVIDEETAIFWHRFYWIGIILMVPSSYAFAVNIFNPTYKKTKILISYLLYIPFLVVLPTKLLIEGVEKQVWGYDTLSGPLMIPFVTIFIINLIVILYFHAKAIFNKTLPQLKRRQNQFMFFGVLIMAVAVFDLLPIIDLFNYPIGFLPLLVWAVIIVYTIIRYQLFKVTPTIATPAIINTMADVLLVTDAKGKIIIVNKPAAKILKLSRGKILGKHVSEFLPITSGVLQKLGKIQIDNTRIFQNKETFIKAKDGEEIAVSLSATSVIGPDGYPAGIVIICHNVQKYLEARKAREVALATAQKKGAELKRKVDQLEKTKNAMEQLVNDLNAEKSKIEYEKARDEAVLLAIGDGLIVTDREGKIIIVNRVFEKMLGWKKEEVLNKPMTEVIPMQNEEGKDVPSKHRLKPLMLYTGKSITPTENTFYSTTETYYYVCKDKSRFPVKITETPIIFEEGIIGAVQVFRDVTEEKKIDQAKSEFVSIASHQLRTPLSAVNWYIEALLGGGVGKFSKKQGEYLKEIYIASQRMVRLVSELLNVSRLELGTFAIEPKLIDIRKIADTVLKDLLPRIAEKDLDVEKKYQKGLPKIKVDPALARIVIQNLLSNAVKYTPNKGHVTLTMKTQKDKLLIEVADTGYGIPADQQSKVFTKLFRAKNVVEKRPEGTGLGLYIVKSILDKSGGEITFESKEKVGTTFYVKIPLSGMKRKKGRRYLT